MTDVSFVKKAGSYIAVFCVTVCVLTLLLAASALIPRERLRANMTESARILHEKDDYYNEIENIFGSKIDWFADSVLLNIAYHFDKDKPFTSVMTSAYYYTRAWYQSTDLLESLEKDLPANRQYLRYWHGSAVIVRLMHLFTDIRGMHITFGVLIALLFAGLNILLIKKGYGYAALSFTVSMIAVNAWFVPFSLEYTWMFIVMPICTGICVVMAAGGKEAYIPLIMFTCGIVANYLDFLTTETITFTIPLLLVFYIMTRGREAEKKDFILIAKSTASWGVGYVLMWVSKWILAGIILCENTIPYVKEHIAERLDGDAYGLSTAAVTVSAPIKNLRCIFPFEYGAAGAVIIIICVLIIIYFLYVYGINKNAQRSKTVLYLIAGMIPYIRYIILHNHSFKHFFFTYRAQMATVLALMLILGEYAGKRTDRVKRKDKR